MNATTRYPEYDSHDNRRKITDPNDNTTEYIYDDFGRLCKTISPDTGITTYLYDEAGNLKQKKDANGTIVNYTYDALNRLTAIQFPSDLTQNVSLSYDSTSVSYGIGRLTGRIDPSGSYVFHYDAHGNMIKEEKTISGVVYTTQYAYDKNDFISTITYPSSRTVTYLPDDVRRVGGAKMSFNQQEKTLASSISYLPYGGVTGLTYGNGLTLTQQYDNQYRITSIVAGTGGSVLNRSYSVYDANGNVKKIMDVLQTTWNTAGESAETYSYELNASGNSNKNKLMGIQRSTSITFGYDFNGNITLANNRTYVYDLSNRLKEVLENTVSIAEYVYNGIGQRIIKDSQAGMRIFHYDPWGHLIAETNQAGNMLAEYIYLGDQLLAMVKPGEAVYYFHNDHLGTPQVITDAIGNVAWKATYTPFGQANITIGTVENNFRFPGQYYDSETGLHYNYYRYYDPTTGRYVTPDPIGLDGGINLFTYVAGNPLRWVDPLGLAWTDWQEVIATIEGTTAQGLRATTSYNFNTDTDFFVALPSEHLRGKRVEIQVNGIWVEVSVGDVGPWNGGHTFGGTSLDDPYWETNRRPQAECGTDLRGRPTNRGGIDISASLAKLLRLRGTTRERWRGVP